MKSRFEEKEGRRRKGGEGREERKKSRFEEKEEKREGKVGLRRRKGGEEEK